MWPIQVNGVNQTLAAIEARQSPIVLCSPTGTGKTRMMGELAFAFIGVRKRVGIYCNRTLLIEQMSKGMKALGLEHDFRVADKPETTKHLLTIVSVQTEDRRTAKAPQELEELEKLFEAGGITNDDYYRQRYALERQKRDIMDFDLVIFDEGHLMTGRTIRRIIAHHIANEAAVVLVTATPVNLEFCNKLVVAGTVSDGRGCGALVWARHHGCTEPDLKTLKINPGDDTITESNARKAIMTHGIFGHVLTHWKRLNPEQKPTLLFAAGVAESIYFAEEFLKAGIRSAHLDGEDIWLDGEYAPTSEAGREEVIELCRAGEVKVLCNRFVLREGIDLPFIRHGILATLFGSLASYLQACGRLLRADRDEETIRRYGPKEWATIQDHGGHWWRLGSVNMDRPWELALPSHAYVGVLQERMRKDPKEEPKLCPECGMVRVRGKCPACDKELKVGRMVIQHDGQLIEHTGPLCAPREEKKFNNTQGLWDRCFWGARRGPKGMTFHAAIGWFMVKYHYWPVRTLNHMPIKPIDWFRKVRSIKREDCVRCFDETCRFCTGTELPPKPKAPPPPEDRELF